MVLIALSLSITRYANAATDYIDTFSGNLSAWVNQNGNWAVESGKLSVNYDISCGSSSCPQADLILDDQYQPSGDYQASVDFNRTGDPNHPGYYATSAQFSLWKDSNNRIVFSIGGGGESNWGGVQNTISVQVGGWYGSSTSTGTYNATIPYTWNADQPQTAVTARTNLAAATQAIQG